jgi:tetratricopeptide (TPR) repeat protein
MTKSGRETEAADHADWDAVEQATELMQEGRFREALYALRDVARDMPRNPYAFHFMGVALFETGQIEPARDALRAAVRIAPNYQGARVALAQTLRILGDVRGAIEQAEIALRKQPGDADALYAAGLAHAARGDREAAKLRLEAFLATNPELEAAAEARAVLDNLDRDEGVDRDDEPDGSGS